MRDSPPPPSHNPVTQELRKRWESAEENTARERLREIMGRGAGEGGNYELRKKIASASHDREKLAYVALEDDDEEDDDEEDDDEEDGDLFIADHSEDLDEVDKVKVVVMEEEEVEDVVGTMEEEVEKLEMKKKAEAEAEEGIMLHNWQNERRKHYALGKDVSSESMAHTVSVFLAQLHEKSNVNGTHFVVVPGFSQFREWGRVIHRSCPKFNVYMSRVCPYLEDRGMDYDVPLPEIFSSEALDRVKKGDYNVVMLTEKQELVERERMQKSGISWAVVAIDDKTNRTRVTAESFRQNNRLYSFLVTRGGSNTESSHASELLKQGQRAIDNCSPSMHARVEHSPLELSASQKMLFKILVDRFFFLAKSRRDFPVPALIKILEALKRNCIHPYHIDEKAADALYAICGGMFEKQKFFVISSSKFLFLEKLFRKKERIIVMSQDRQVLQLVEVFAFTEKHQFVRVQDRDMSEFTSLNNDAPHILLLPVEHCATISPNVFRIAKHIVLMDGPSMAIPRGLIEHTTVYKLSSTGSVEQNMLNKIRLDQNRMQTRDDSLDLETQLDQTIGYLRAHGNDEMIVNSVIPEQWESVTPESVLNRMIIMAASRQSAAEEQLFNNLEWLVIQQSNFLRDILFPGETHDGIHAQRKAKIHLILRRCKGLCHAFFNAREIEMIDRWIMITRPANAYISETLSSMNAAISAPDHHKSPDSTLLDQFSSPDARAIAQDLLDLVSTQSNQSASPPR